MKTHLAEIVNDTTEQPLVFLSKLENPESAQQILFEVLKDWGKLWLCAEDLRFQQEQAALEALKAELEKELKKHKTLSWMEIVQRLLAMVDEVLKGSVESKM